MLAEPYLIPLSIGQSRPQKVRKNREGRREEGGGRREEGGGRREEGGGRREEGGGRREEGGGRREEGGGGRREEGGGRREEGGGRREEGGGRREEGGGRREEGGGRREEGGGRREEGGGRREGGKFNNRLPSLSYFYSFFVGYYRPPGLQAYTFGQTKQDSKLVRRTQKLTGLRLRYFFILFYSFSSFIFLFFCFPSRCSLSSNVLTILQGRLGSKGLIVSKYFSKGDGPLRPLLYLLMLKSR